MDGSGHLVRELSSKVFAERATAMLAGDPLDRALWARFTETGLDRLLDADDATSLGDVAAVLRDAGRGAARIPAAEAMLANHLAAKAGWNEASAVPTLVYSPAGWGAVPWGRMATSIYFLSGDRIARVPAPFVVSRACANLAGEPRDDLHVQSDRAEVSGARMAPGQLAALGAFFRAALMAGAMQRAFELAVEHARNRVQFGKPIAKFQAVQQMLAQLAGQCAAASAAVDLAAGSFSQFTAAVAKSRASESVRLVTDFAHQVTGAMGFTEEFALHRFTKRLWAWREENGSEMDWNRWLGQRLLERRTGRLWTVLSEPLCAGDLAND